MKKKQKKVTVVQESYTCPICRNVLSKKTRCPNCKYTFPGYERPWIMIIIVLVVLLIVIPKIFLVLVPAFVFYYFINSILKNSGHLDPISMIILIFATLFFAFYLLYIIIEDQVKENENTPTIIDICKEDILYEKL